MPGAERVDGLQFISQGDRTYPDRLIRRLGADAPKTISFVGAPTPLSSAMTAFLCSKETPGATILKAFDQVAAWRDAGRCVISGFHSPLEQQCLDILLRGKQPIVMALARGLGALRLPAAQRKALDDGRLTIISPFPETDKRATADLARQRNRFVAALADEVVFAFVSPGGSLALLVGELAGWGVELRQLHRFDEPLWKPQSRA
jgi:predicted Rossmann fold nucleotide-binding protein DprA/Smf involved in DNA uptake